MEERLGFDMFFLFGSFQLSPRLEITMKSAFGYYKNVFIIWFGTFIVSLGINVWNLIMVVILWLWKDCIIVWIIALWK